MDYIVQILRTLFFNIDRVVYAGVGNVYDLLLRISRATILDSETIEGFYGRIYALIGIFMLFKISLSLITYILNPDEFVDKEKGFASIIKRVIISLVMLVLVPYAFKEAYALQAMVLEDNTLAALVFGDVNNNYQIDSAGEKMKFILMYTFFQPNYNGLYESDGDVNLASCAITYQYESDGKVVENNGVFVLNSDCFGPLSDGLYDIDNSTYGKYWKEASQDDLYQTYAQGVARQNFNLMFKHNITMLQKKDAKGVYLVDYMFPLSTAVGVAVLWVLLMFCIDVAVRSIKLAFYQLIAPVPILSYIDPKSKDGMFNKWLKQCGTTYASLFIRLLALYIAIYLISQVSSSGIQDVVTGERITDWWVCIFVIIGVLMFAKQLPKILEDTLGFKGTGDFTLNPLKKLEDGMLGGKAIKRVGGTAAAVGVAGGLAFGSNLIGGIASGRGFKSIGSAIAGTTSAMGRATLGGLKGEKFGKNWASSYGAAMQAKQSRADRKDDGVKWGEMMTSKVQQKVGLHTAGEKATAAADMAKAIQEDYKQYVASATGTDKFAKFADYQAKAAQQRGDYTEQKKWEDFRDERIKQISKTGKVRTESSLTVTENNFDMVMGADGKMHATIFDNDAYGRVDRTTQTTSTASRSKEADNIALQSLAQHMDALVGALNKSVGSVQGLTSISQSTSADGVKAVSDQAKGRERDVRASNTHQQDVDKYGAKKGQK